jgi:predicted membrane protein
MAACCLLVVATREHAMENDVWLVSALWMGLALVASVISIWVGISVALIEIMVGVIAGIFMGHSAIYNRIIGGKSDRLVRLAPCTVTVVK